MVFGEVPAKRYFLGRGIAFCALALSFIVVLLLVDADATSWTVFGIASLFFLILALHSFRKYKHCSTDEVVHENIQAAPPQDQMKNYKPLLIVTVIIFPMLSAFAAWDLHELESGNVESVYVWFVLAFIYKHAGYWPTVLSPLVIGALCIIIFRWRYNKLKEAVEDEASEDPFRNRF
jgi:hypothetical protein